MYVPIVVAIAVIVLFAFPALALGASKVVKSRFNSERPEPPRPNKSSRNIPGGKSRDGD